jgi:putative oxidoreductase
VRSPGAASVIDSTKSPLPGDGRFDVILDLAGSCPWSVQCKALAPRGTLVLGGGEGADRGGMGRALRAALWSMFLKQRPATLLGFVKPEPLHALADILVWAHLVDHVIAHVPVRRRWRAGVRRGECARRRRVAHAVADRRHPADEDARAPVRNRRRRCGCQRRHWPSINAAERCDQADASPPASNGVTVRLPQTTAFHSEPPMLDSFKTPLTLVARLLLALMFVLAGFSKLGSIAGTAGYIASQGLPMPQLLAVGSGAFEIVAGLMLAIGWQARWAALALALFTLLASVIFHAFWSMPAEQQMMQQLMFMKNLAVAGGLFFVAAMGSGPASLDARLKTA